MSNKFDKNIARMHILNYVTSYCLTIKFTDDDKKYPGSDHFKSYIGGGRPEIGDLVALEGTRQKTKWYLSWYVGFKPRGDYYSDINVLESIEDGELCNWSNVGFKSMDREIISEHPEWRWSDKQFRFYHRWYRVIKEKRKFNFTIPCGPFFDSEGYGVTLGTRTRFQMAGETRKRFVDWRKVRIKDMIEYYDQVAWGDDI